jgi:phospholipid/cholesterol/gamma-HCH transport system substrate-binding protein/paraquat-inducible protein B
LEEKKGYFHLGLFVVIALAILFAVLFVLGGRSLFRPTLTFETYFDTSVSGLEVGAPVQFRGVPIGKISAILMSSAVYEDDVPADKRKPYIVVRATLSGNAAQVEQWREELADYVKGGLRAQTQLAGVTGQQYLALDRFDPEKYPMLKFDWTPDYPYVPSAPSLTGQIIGKVQKLMASLNEADIRALAKNLNTLIETLSTKAAALPIEDLSGETMNLLKEALATIERLNRVIANARIDEAVNNIADVSGRLDELLANPGLKQTVDNTAAFTGRLRATAETGRIDRIVKDLDRTIQRIDALIGDNQYDVRVIVQDLRVTADNLRTVSESAKRYPGGILFGGPPEKSELPWKRSK